MVDSGRINNTRSMMSRNVNTQHNIRKFGWPNVLLISLSIEPFTFGIRWLSVVTKKPLSLLASFSVPLKLPSNSFPEKKQVPGKGSETALKKVWDWAIASWKGNGANRRKRTE